MTTLPFMLFSTVMVALIVLSIDNCYSIIRRFCATNLHSCIAKSINTSPYNMEMKAQGTPKYRSKQYDAKSGFIREMDIVNGFQLCDSKYKSLSQSMFCWWY